MAHFRSTLLAIVVLVIGVAVASAQEKKKSEKPEKKSGTITGVVTAKEKNWIEVKADGEEKARRYMPQWLGNASGGLDKEILKKIAEIKVNSRVRLEWEFDERARVVKIEVLKSSGGKDEPSKEKK